MISTTGYDIVTCVNRAWLPTEKSASNISRFGMDQMGRGEGGIVYLKCSLSDAETSQFTRGVFFGNIDFKNNAFLVA